TTSNRCWPLGDHARSHPYFCQRSPRFFADTMGATLKGCSVEGHFTVSPSLAERFFDHLIRHGESYSEKWEYVRQNPVRAGLVHQADDWPWQGEIVRLEARSV